MSESKDSCMISRSALDLSQVLRKLSDDSVIQIEMTKYFKTTKEKLLSFNNWHAEKVFEKLF